MTPERWKQISLIYERALKRAASDRAAFLAEACAGDGSLQREIQALLDQPTSPKGLEGLTPSTIAHAMGGDDSGLTGRQFGVYLVHERIGVGGMGEVYRARDTRLGRDVAIKVLPQAFATDADRLARFEREARVLASLDHPHIGAIHSIEEIASSTGSSPAVKALVLSLVDGETLAERIARGPIPMAESLEYARQIADGLEAAHDKGIVHRDLKPGNIKITPAGVVKVLDFGLAKALGPSGATYAAPDLARSPTMTSGVTHEGLILGTVAYMSPEQARGLKVDKRTDVWAFGCVVYEMVTGRIAFDGETVSDTITAILGQEVDWNALPNSTPRSVYRLLHRCLAKDATHRLRDIGDAKLDLKEASEPDPSEAPHRRSSSVKSVGWIPAFGAVLGALAIGSLASALYFRRAPVEAPEMRMEITTPGADSFDTDFALSPDGRTLAFVAAASGIQQVWLRALDAETARPLAGTEGGFRPFWSPDSRSIAFYANGQIKRIDVAGGLPMVLAPQRGSQGGTWSTTGEILFTNDTGPLYRVSARGGDAVAATRVDPPRVTAHWHPAFLPDGRHFLFLGWGAPATKGVYLGSLDSLDTHRLFAANSRPVFSPPDRVLYARQGALVAQRLDLKTWQPIGEPLPVADAVAVDIWGGDSVAASASATGLVAYRSTWPVRQLAWMDRSDRQMGTLGAPDTARLSNFGFRRSPDGRSLAFARQAGEYSDIWLLDITSGVSQRFTFEAANKLAPVWSPDGRRIVYSWDLAGVLDLYVKAVDGTGNGTLLWSSPEPKGANDWSADGQFILYTSSSVKTSSDLWALPLSGDKKPMEVAHSAFMEYDGRFSPDGRLVVYHSNESGQAELHIQPFPGPGGNKRITSGGGVLVEWARDSRTLVYREAGKVMAVPITLNGSVVELGKPVAQEARPYSITQSPDGQQFLRERIVKPAPPVTILLNWKASSK